MKRAVILLIVSIHLAACEGGVGEESDKESFFLTDSFSTIEIQTVSGYTDVTKTYSGTISVDVDTGNLHFEMQNGMAVTCAGDVALDPEEVQNIQSLVPEIQAKSSNMRVFDGGGQTLKLDTSVYAVNYCGDLVQGSGCEIIQDESLCNLRTYIDQMIAASAASCPAEAYDDLLTCR